MTRAIIMSVLDPQISQWDLEQLIAEYGYQYVEGGTYPDLEVTAVRGEESIWLGAKAILLACSIEHLRTYRMNKLNR